jgi:uncharacterized OsmC-like protein
MGLNNVNLEAVERFTRDVEHDPAQAKRTKRVVSEWVLAEGRPQVRANLEYPTGLAAMVADGPPFLGGAGRAPDPVQICLFGLAACYAGSFALTAAAEGIELRRLQVVAENHLDLSAAMGLSENPLVEGITLTVRVEADAPRERLEEVQRIARHRCPGVFCVTQPIPLTIQLAE